MNDEHDPRTMDPTVKAEWIKALRSGKYQQGIGSLRYSHDISAHIAHCCLGVLCDISGLGEWGDSGEAGGTGTGEWRWRRRGSSLYKTKYNKSEVHLPNEVIEWAGLQTDDPRVGTWHKPQNKTLAGLNDAGYSFDQIADVIEKEF